jgi:hypothetical protein
MAQFLSGRKSILNVGVTSSTENKTVLQITGKVGIGTTDAIQNLHVEGSTYISGNLGIGTTNPTSKLSVSGDATAFRFFGDFIGGIGSITQLQVTGISTFTNGPVLVGAATSTGTASQPLQITGGAYVSGNLGIGITNPTKQLSLSDDIGIGRSIYDSTGDSGVNEYVLTSSSTGILWRAVTGIGAITGINITQNNSDSINYIPFVNVSSATTATAYVAPSDLTYNPSTNNLGIGTTNATSKLTVQGDGKFSGVVTAITFVGNLDGYASSAGIATYADYSGIATYSDNAGIATYADYSGIATYADNAGIATYADNAGISTNLKGGAASQIAYQVSPGITSFIANGTPGYILQSNGSDVPSWFDPADGFNVSTANYALVAGIATNATNAGIATYATSSGIATYATNAGIATYATNAGIATYADNAGIATVATKLQNIRTFEITGDIVAAPQNFDGSANVSFASSIQPDTVGLGTHTYGDYVKNITGTTGEIEVSVTSGEGVSPQIGLPDNVTISDSLRVVNDVQIDRNLNVTGNITIGGTSAYLSVENLVVKDRDIIAGFVTDAYGNDASTDITANTGGIAIASTEGSPLVNLNVVGFETLPPTYKKIMWFKANTFAGLNTDAWMFNYGVGIGSTQIPNGVRLAVGGVQITDYDIPVVRNINASGIITASTFVGNVSGIGSTAINLQGGAASQIAYQVSPGITSFIANGTPGWLLQSDGDNVPYWVNPAFGFNVSNADYALVAGIATYATYSGIATYATNSGVSTSVIGGIGSITQLQVTGISTFTNGPVLVGTATSTGTASQPLQVTGGAYVSGNLGIGTTNPTSKLTISGALRTQALGIGSEFIVSDTGSFVPSVSIAATIGSGTTEKVLLRSISRNQGTLDVVSNYRQTQMMNVSDTNSEGVFRVTALETSTVAFVAPIYRQLLVVGESGIVTTRNAVAIATANATAASGTVGADIYGNVNIRGPFSTSTSYVAIAPNYRDRGALSFEAPIGAASTNSVTQLFSITNNVSSSIFRINDLSRNPILEANVAGNIGIGTSLPSSKLEVLGEVRIVSAGATESEKINIKHYRDISYRQSLGVGATNNKGALSFEGTSAFAGIGTTMSLPVSLLAITDDVSDNVFSVSGYRYYSGSRDSALDVTTSGRLGIGITNPVTDFQINRQSYFSQNVGIGTSIPATQLDIRGGLLVSGAGATSTEYVTLRPQTIGINTLVPSRGGISYEGELNSTASSGGQLLTILNDNTSIFTVTKFAGLSSTRLAPAGQRNVDTVFQISSSGNIGIGTTNPIQPFQVGAAGTNVVVIDSIGEVGIGTTNPQQKLHVVGNVLVAAGSSTDQYITLKPYELSNGTLSWEGSAGQLFSITNSLSTGSIFSVNDISGIPSIDVDAGGAVTLGAYGGNIGVGTTNPTSKLHVVGDARVGINTSQGIILTSPNGTKYRLIVSDDGTVSTVLVV